MSKVKKMKVKNPDGNFSEYIDIGADAANIDLASGDTVESKITEMDSTVNNLSTVATSGDYTDLLNKPTKLSEFSNDKNFIDNTVKNLTNYYDKTTLDGMLAAISTLDIQTITDFPESPSKTTIYLKKKDTEGSQNIYDEYLYVNNSWEKIGDTEIDLSNYYNKKETENLINKSNDIPVLEFVLPDDITGGSEEYVVPEDLDEVLNGDFQRGFFTMKLSSSGQEKMRKFIDSFGTENFENKQCIIKLQINTKKEGTYNLVIYLSDSYCRRQGQYFHISAYQSFKDFNNSELSYLLFNAFDYFNEKYDFNTINQDQLINDINNLYARFDLDIDNANDLALGTLGEDNAITIRNFSSVVREQKTPLIIDFSDLMQMGKQKSIYEWVANYFNISEQEAYCGLHSTTQPAKYRFFLSGRRMELENFYIEQPNYEDPTEYLHATSFYSETNFNDALYPDSSLKFLDSMAKIAQDTNYVDIDELLMSGIDKELIACGTWNFDRGDWDIVKSWNPSSDHLDSYSNIKNFIDYVFENKPEYIKIKFPSSDSSNSIDQVFYSKVIHPVDWDTFIICLENGNYLDNMMNFMNEDNSHTAFIISNYYIMAAPEMMTVINYNYSPYNLNQISSANRSELPFACVAAKARNEETAQAESVLNPEIFYYYTE